MLEPEVDWPCVYWQPNGVWKLVLVVDGGTKEYQISKRNVGILLRSIGSAYEREDRPQELVEHDERCAI